MDRGLRYFGGAVAFGFAAVWIMWSLDAAIVCLLAAGGGYGAVFVAQRIGAALATRAGSRGMLRAGRTPEAEYLSLRADELNQDLGHVYEPTTPHRPVQPPPAGDDAER